MANFTEQMQKIFDDFEKQFGAEPVSLDIVAEWAIQQGRFVPSPRSVVKLCREALADSLREEKRVDPNGRVYRAKHSIRTSAGGVQLTLWADIDTAPKTFMERSFAQRRKGIVSDCFQIKQDVDHFNETRGGERPIQMVIDFTDDVAEMEAFRDQQSGDSKAA
jgi:hypothetical protein